MSLLKKVVESDELLKSNILTSLQPKIGKKYVFRDLQQQAEEILLKCRESLIKISIEEVERVNKNQNNEVSVFRRTNYNITGTEIDSIISKTSRSMEHEIKKKHDQKIFHFSNTVTVKPKPVSREEKKKAKRRNHRKLTSEKRKIRTQKYKKNVRERKLTNLKEEVQRIKDANIVVNLSSMEIPDVVYIYLAHGLNFIEAHKPLVENLRFDLNEFIRKLSWKVYFSIYPTTETEEEDLHANLRVKSNKYPDMAPPPLLDEIKNKVLGWVSSFQPEKPESNLTPQALRGKKWVVDTVSKNELFVTKADKGGSILIMNYSDVEEAMDKELAQEDKYVIISEEPDSYRSKVVGEIREKMLDLEKRGLIGAKDREIITGLNKNLNMRHNPEFRAIDPTMYPLFKIHKLSKEQIQEKQIPPGRFVYNTKFGPLYRTEKWMSPHLTTISKEYCKDEYLRDTDDFLGQIEDWNNITNSIPKKERQKIHLFTLDVKALYPSIRPDIAKFALADALQEDRTTAGGIKVALKEMTDLLFDKSFVACKGKCYQPQEGIPTGGCNSRQTADCTLHWLLETVRGDIPSWEFIELFKRFIDDIFGIWKGTERQFRRFVELLNQQTKLYGIEFGDFSIGDTVHFLDVTVYINEDGLLQYRLYRKATDSRHYLKKGSFHPNHVFNAVAYSQMMRVTRRNSVEEQAKKDVEDLKEDLRNCGYKEEDLVKLQKKVEESRVANVVKRQMDDKPVITAVLDFFKEINDLKGLIRTLEPDINRLLGEPTSVLVATRKGPSIRNRVVKNRSLCEHKVEAEVGASQRCNSRKCKSCPQMLEEGKSMLVNGFQVKPLGSHTCKSKNVVYVAQCTICEGKPVDSAYVGQTQQKFHQRANGHRACFVANDPDTIEKSALALHAKERHPDQFNMGIFRFAIVDSVQGGTLNRREARAIHELRTNVMGLNRMYIQKGS